MKLTVRWTNGSDVGIDYYPGTHIQKIQSSNIVIIIDEVNDLIVASYNLKWVISIRLLQVEDPK